jgi:hypothetical protein
MPPWHTPAAQLPQSFWTPQLSTRSPHQPGAHEVVVQHRFDCGEHSPAPHWPDALQPHWKSLKHTGPAALSLHCALSVHSTQLCVASAQCDLDGVVHCASLTQPGTQRCWPVSHTGVDGFVQFWSVRHATHACVLVSQTAPGQLASLVHATHAPCAVLQAGVAPLHSASSRQIGQALGETSCSCPMPSRHAVLQSAATAGVVAQHAPAGP